VCRRGSRGLSDHQESKAFAAVLEENKDHHITRVHQSRGATFADLELRE
jgi:hypothetical protein